MCKVRSACQQGRCGPTDSMASSGKYRHSTQLMMAVHATASSLSSPSDPWHVGGGPQVHKGFYIRENKFVAVKKINVFERVCCARLLSACCMMPCCCST